MIGVIPRDYWQHSPRDLAAGIAGCLKTSRTVNSLEFCGANGFVPLRSGRAAVVAGIQALRLNAGASVGVPLYCCSVVFQAVEAAGCRVRFLDIEPDTFGLSPGDLAGKRSELDAVIVVHMFGNPCEMEEILRVDAGLPVIEDCAQALGSRLNGRPCGSWGDVAFFSFRSGKYVSAGEGGALFSRKPEIAQRIREIVASLPEPGVGADVLHAAKVYLKSLLRRQPLYGLIGLRLWTSLSETMNLSDSSPVTVGQIHRSDFAITLRRLRNITEQIERQRRNAAYLSQKLLLDPGMVYSERPHTFHNRYLFPITFQSQAARDAMASFLLSRGVDTMKYLDHTVDIATRRYGYHGDCPVAESLIKRVLTIPVYHTLEPTDLDYIVACVNSGWSHIRANLS